MRHNIDIVCFSLSRWDAEISSPAVALAKQFAKTNRVFFIEHPFSLKDLADKKNSSRKSAAIQAADKTPDRSYSKNLIVVRPPLVLPINFLPGGLLYKFLYSLNNRILVNTLRKTLREFNIPRYIFINFFDPFFLSLIPNDIKPEKYVYHCMDDMSQVEYTSRHGVALENEIIRKADLVLCTSTRLVELKKMYSNKVYLHANAADFELFNSASSNQFEKPADLIFGDRKIIGFTGSIEYRTDFELLKKVAKYHAGKILFLLGPVTGEEHIIAGLEKLDNVVFAGPRNISQLPGYLHFMDCCIIPYKKNILTASIYPLKINEYLAAGKPVVTTAFSKDIRHFSDVAYVAESDEEFVRLIDKAIEEDDENKKAARINAAAGNTWEKRVEQFWELVT